MKVNLYVMILIFCSCNIFPKKNSSGICYGDKEFEKIVETPFRNLNNLKDQNTTTIKLKGVFHFNFEDIAIYPNSSSNSYDALWIHFTDEIIKNTTELERINGLNVIVLGVLDLSRKGHDNSYFGTLDSVFCIKVK